MLIRALEEEPSLIVPGGEGHCVPRKVLIHTKSSLMLGVLLCSFYNHLSFKEGFKEGRVRGGRKALSPAWWPAALWWAGASSVLG